VWNKNGNVFFQIKIQQSMKRQNIYIVFQNCLQYIYLLVCIKFMLLRRFQNCLQYIYLLICIKFMLLRRV